LLKRKGIEFHADWSSTLYHKDDVPFTPEQTPDVFTNFRKQCETKGRIRPLSAVPQMKPVPSLDGLESFLDHESCMIQTLKERYTKEEGSLQDRLCKLLPWTNLDKICVPDMRAGISFEGGETAALKRLQHYLWDSDAVQTYKETRNQSLGMDYSTKFSPYLSLGCLSPRKVYWELQKYESERVGNESTYWVIFELLWRDFWKFAGVKYGNGLFYLDGPLHLRSKNMSRSTDGKGSSYSRSWKNDPITFEQWTTGQTGIPWVDAGMRELNATGFMSNRLRQNVASFLSLSLGMDWRLGAAYFESLLIDHDVQSNYGNWQYVAGVGTDPRDHRKFNMIKQAKDYDPRGDYVQTWIDELQSLPKGDHGLLMPWEAQGGLPRNYPPPVVIEQEWSKFSRRGGFSKGGKGDQKSKPRTSDWKVKRFK
jgi:deoxyribodipyrimidine photo-lyase